jgi:hypothetical protein
MVVKMKQYLNFGFSFENDSDPQSFEEHELTEEAVEEIFIRAIFGDQILDMPIEDWMTLNSNTSMDTLLYTELMRKYGL